jgi:exopolysaccharide transport family protein
MLQPSTDHHRLAAYGRRLPVSADTEEKADGEIAVLLNILTSLRRNMKLIAAIGVAGALVTAAAVFMMAPKYVATVTLLVDPRQTRILQDAEVVSQLKVDSRDAGVIDSEVELMRSDTVMRRVAERLDLKDDDEFGGPGGLVARIKRIVLLPLRLMFGSDQAAEDDLSGVVSALADNTSAKRRGMTYVIDLNVWSQDARKAARIANTFAESYLDEQLAAKANATQRATRWLNARVEELRGQVTASEKALEQYRAEAGLSAVFRSNLEPGGQRLADQQVAKLSEQLVDARAKAAQAQAKYEQLRQITRDKLVSAAASPDVLQSTVVSNLRAQYADAARQLAERAARYGAQHPQVATARAQVSDLDRLISAEIGRIVASARTEYEMAKSREDSLIASLEELKQRATAFDQAAIRLQELQREADTNRDLFKSFLSRARQTAELDMQIPDSRVVAQAAVPINPASPRKGLAIGLGFVGSLGLGMALVLAREMFSSGFRRAAEIEQALGLQPLASVPRVAAFSPSAADRLHALRGGPVLRLAGPDGASRDGAGRARRRNAGRSLADFALEQPGSAFAESIRTLYFGLRQRAGEAHIGVVMVTSAMPGEGKSTVALNLGRLAAQTGSRVLLIDGDLRRPCVAAALGIEGHAGLVELLRGETGFRSCVWKDAQSALYAIANLHGLSGMDSLMLLSSPDMRELIGHVRNMFDLVIIDSPPLSPVADSRVLVNYVDGVVLVVASGRTSREAVAAVLKENPDVEERIAGVVLNGSADDNDHYYYEPVGAAAGAAS